MYSCWALRGVEVWYGQACLGLVFVASGILKDALSPATLWPRGPLHSTHRQWTTVRPSLPSYCSCHFSSRRTTLSSERLEGGVSR